MVMIQIRHVPEALHQVLKERASTAGMSLSDDALAELSKAASRPTMEEVRRRIAARTAVEVDASEVLAALSAVRGEREDRIAALLAPAHRGE